MAEPSAPFDPWLLVTIIVGGFLAGLLVLLAAHVAFPRREWKTVGEHALIMCDKWTGRCQRVEWDVSGKQQLSDVYVAP